jgi:hypothetical protein
VNYTVRDITFSEEEFIFLKLLLEKCKENYSHLFVDNILSKLNEVEYKNKNIK